MSVPKSLPALPKLTPSDTSVRIIRSSKTESELLGRIMVLVRQALLDTPKSTAVTEPEPTESINFPKINSHEKAYISYVAYCETIGGVCPITGKPLKPRGIANWHLLRDKQDPKKEESPTVHKVKRDRGQKKFARCLHCGTDFPTLSAFEFCGETPISQGKCKREWLEAHPAVCGSRIAERPVRFDAHVARSSSCPSLPEQVEKPIDIDLTPGAEKVTPPFTYRNDYRIKVLKAKGLGKGHDGRKTPFASLWCVGCESYTEQVHECHSAQAIREGSRARFHSKMATLAPFKSGNYAGCKTSRQLEVIATKERLPLRRGAREYPPAEPADISDRIVVRSLNDIDVRFELIETWGTPPEKYLRENRKRTVNPKLLAIWDSRIDSMDRGTDSKLVYVGASDVSAFASAVSKPIDTSGREGKGADSSKRDRRAKANRKRRAQRTPPTKAYCDYCGAEFWDRKGTKYCPGTTHNQMHHKKLKKLKEEK